MLCPQLHLGRCPEQMSHPTKGIWLLGYILPESCPNISFIAEFLFFPYHPAALKYQENVHSDYIIITFTLKEFL